MRVFVRADGTPQIGSGHIRRCLTLMTAFAQTGGVEIIFLSRHITNGLAKAIAADGYNLIHLSSDVPLNHPDQGIYGAWLGTTQTADAQAVIAAISAVNRTEPTLLLCDHYGLDTPFEFALRAAFPELGIVVIDDLDREHVCDLLIDTTHGKSAVNYALKVTKDTALMIGARYALLRQGFLAQREAVLEARDKRLANGVVDNLLISMGGMDANNVSALVLKAVAALPYPPAHTHVLLGRDAPHLAHLRKQAATLNINVNIHAGIKNVPRLLGQMDMCVGAAGSSTWERCCLGLPTLNFTIADNQRTIARMLSAAGAIVDGGDISNLNVTQISDKIATFLDIDAQLRGISLRARDICDGRGAMRVAAELERIKLYRLVNASQEHIRTVFIWQQDPDTRRYAINPEAPDWEDHNSWMRARLAYNAFYILVAGTTACGLVRLDPYRNGPDLPEGIKADNVREVSILVAPNSYGLGLGTRMLNLLRLRHPDMHIIAHVMDANTASRRLFERCGYKSFAPEHLIQNAAL